MSGAHSSLPAYQQQSRLWSDNSTIDDPWLTGNRPGAMTRFSSQSVCAPARIGCANKSGTTINESLASIPCELIARSIKIDNIQLVELSILIRCLVAKPFRVEHWALSVEHCFSGSECQNSRRARLPHARGMGSAFRDLAFLAATRRDQFPRLIRSRPADLARAGRSAYRIGTSLHQRL